MALELVPPGKRKNNPFFLVRGTIGGRAIEVSTKTQDEAAAQIFKDQLQAKLLKTRIPGQDEDVTFHRAAELYFASKDLPNGDRKRIQRTVDATGDALVSEVDEAVLIALAHQLYSGCKSDTKNRWVISPGAAIVHFAAEKKWCAWQRIKKL